MLYKQLYKVGKTINLKNRLINYNADIYNRKYKEVYQINIDIIKDFVNKYGKILNYSIKN